MATKSRALPKTDALAETLARAAKAVDEYEEVAADRTLRRVRADAQAVARGLALLAEGSVDAALADQAELEAAATRIEAAVEAREAKSLGPDDAFPSVPGIHRWLVFNLLRDSRKILEARARTARAPAPKGKLTTEDELWAILDRVARKGGGALEASCDAFRAELRKLDDRSLVRADRLFAKLMQRAYRWDLWGAAYVIHGGCSDDAFWDFRAGLVALGRARFEAALEDPDGLAKIRDVEERTLFEGFQYVPRKVLAEREIEAPASRHQTARPAGRAWKEDELPGRCPRLWKRFG